MLFKDVTGTSGFFSCFVVFRVQLRSDGFYMYYPNAGYFCPNGWSSCCIYFQMFVMGDFDEILDQ